MDLKATLKTTPKYIKILADAWITSVKDFLQYFPRAYEDRSTIRNLNELIFNEKGIEVIVGARGHANDAVSSYLQGDLKSTGSVCHDHNHSSECGN